MLAEAQALARAADELTNVDPKRAIQYHREAAARFCSIANSGTKSSEAIKALLVVSKNHEIRAERLSQRVHSAGTTTSNAVVAGISRWASNFVTASSTASLTPGIGHMKLKEEEDVRRDPYQTLWSAVGQLIGGGNSDDNDNDKVVAMNGGYEQQQQQQQLQKPTSQSSASLTGSFFIVGGEQSHFQSRSRATKSTLAPVSPPLITFQNHQAPLMEEDSSGIITGEYVSNISDANEMIHELRRQIHDLKDQMRVLLLENAQLNTATAENNLLKQSIVQFKNNVQRQQHHRTKQQYQVAAFAEALSSSMIVPSASTSNLGLLSSVLVSPPSSPAASVSLEQLQRENQRLTMEISKYRHRWEKLKATAKTNRNKKKAAAGDEQTKGLVSMETSLT